ncbi:hypothetical protein [Bacillus sp. RAR_GA_16]|uniref:hypothetical protein n=1 Tax=Bacillus sp. RAR_GA_16 TaxID=2876774 RepID=UPI001CCFABF3|nr:hypothetical protein [Bacillus sp. RAR_GA_16]MCA0172928.1 hypothetical protein [Bacillus sp. RAR_GA_16]
MANCTNCHYKWGVKELWSLGFSKSGKECPNCRKKQYLSSETKNMFTLGYLSMLFIIILPFYIKLSDKDEPLW